MNRIDRVSAILIQLQSRRVIKAADIAERFSISLRTVYRDIKTLEEAGIPLIGEAGIGYSIMDGYRLPPVAFTKEEATAFLTAEKFVAQLTDASTARHHQSAMFKVRAVLKASERDLLEDIDNNIEVLKNQAQLHIDHQDHLQPLLNAVAKKTVLFINYVNNSAQQTSRQVEPIGIFYKDSYWHLIAYCRLRAGYRDFRVDRLQRVTHTSEHFNTKHPTLKDYITKTAEEQQLHTVVIRVEKSIYNRLDYQKYYSGFISERYVGEMIEMTFLTSSLEGFARWFMMFGDSAEIMAPSILKERISEICCLITKRNFEPAVSC